MMVTEVSRFDLQAPFPILSRPHRASIESATSFWLAEQFDERK